MIRPARVESIESRTRIYYARIALRDGRRLGPVHPRHGGLADRLATAGHDQRRRGDSELLTGQVGLTMIVAAFQMVHDLASRKHLEPHDFEDPIAASHGERL